MSIKVDQLGTANQSTQSREVSSRQNERLAEQKREEDSKSVVNQTTPELSSPERAGELIGGILKKAEENPDSIAEAQSGLSEQRVLELLSDDDI